jgi:defect in organelle trafficking protein DotC
MKKKILTMAVSLLLTTAAVAQSVAESKTLKELGGSTGIASKADIAVDAISMVRQAALRASAQALGGQAGRRDRVLEIRAMVDKEAAGLDRKYNFGRLILGAGFLPPVITKAENLMTVDSTSIRIGAAAYVIERGAAPAPTNPTWRQWLLLGLDAEAPSVENARAGLPRNPIEKKFFDREMEAAYVFGYEAASQAFDVNYAQLQKEYNGMLTYFELYQRGMVTAPKIRTMTNIVTKNGEKSIVTGDTYFVITTNTEFITDYEKWKPLGSN